MPRYRARWPLRALAAALVLSGCRSTSPFPLRAQRDPAALELEGAERRRCEALIAQLGDEDWSRREEATRGLSEAGEGALPLLRAAATGPDPERSWRARAAIEALQTRRARPRGELRGALLSAARFAGPHLALSPDYQSLRARGETLRSPLVELLRAERLPPDALRVAAALLADCGDPADIPVILTPAEDWLDLRPDVVQQLRETVWTLGRARTPELLSATLVGASDARRRVYLRLMAGADGSTDREFARQLRLAVRDVDPRLRVEGLSAAARSRSGLTAEDLSPLLKDEDRRVRLAACDALGWLGLPGDGACVKPLLAENDAELRLLAVRTLGRLGDPEDFPLLLARLEDVDGGVRHEAVTALGALGDARAIPALLPLLSPKAGDESLTQLAAIEALGRIGGPQSVQALGELLGGGLPPERRWVLRLPLVNALATCGTPAVGALAHALDAGDPDLCEAIMDHLVRLTGWREETVEGEALERRIAWWRERAGERRPPGDR